MNTDRSRVVRGVMMFNGSFPKQDGWRMSSPRDSESIASAVKQRMVLLCTLTLAVLLTTTRTPASDPVPEELPASTKSSSEEGYSRTLRVGLYENKPKIYTNEAGTAAGIFPTVLNEIAKKEGWRIVYVPGTWDECLEAMEQGRIDLMPDVAYSMPRDDKYDFHKEPVVSSWSVIYAPKGNPIRTLTDLDGLRVAVLKGSVQQAVLRQMAAGFSVMIFFVEVDSFDEAFTATANGQADAVAANNLYGDYFHLQYGLESTPVVFNPVLLYFATADGVAPDILAAIDEHLQRMKSQPGSVYYKALQEWIRPIPGTRLPRYVVWALIGIGGGLLVTLLFIVLLRRRVRTATKNLVEANAKLAESEEKFRDIFQKHSAVKLIVNPENGVIVEANEAAEKFYGWSREELLWMRIHDINVLPIERVEEEMKKAANLEQNQFEFRHRLADGTLRDVNVFCNKIDIQGKAYLHSIIQDISSHKQAEEEKEKLQAQLLQSQKMETIGRLAGGIAHDYNNMLSVILGYTELAISQVNPSDRIYSQLTEVLNASKRSADITGQLLAFARRQPMEPRALDLNQAATPILKMLQRLVGENIELIWKPCDAIWATYMDPSHLDQILTNLCANARDAITGEGNIIIETGNITFAETDCADHEGLVSGDYIMLAVSDDGCGMDREIQTQIFEPFFTTKELGKGTGLGLATVYGIIKQNNGFIHVYSEPGRGTTFRIYLPRYEGTVAGTEPGLDEEIPLGDGETILLVEDDEAILILCRTILDSLGYRVLTAGTPSQARRLVRDHVGKIDLLISDVIMPEMNGRELAEILREDCPNLKVMFMSGYSAETFFRRGVLDEDVVFLPKPFSRKGLAAKVSKALGKCRMSV